MWCALAAWLGLAMAPQSCLDEWGPCPPGYYDTGRMKERCLYTEWGNGVQRCFDSYQTEVPCDAWEAGYAFNMPHCPVSNGNGCCWSDFADSVICARLRADGSIEVTP